MRRLDQSKALILFASNHMGAMIAREVCAF
jgi:hypothetical protein